MACPAKYRMQQTNDVQPTLAAQPGLVFAVLTGSRAHGTHREDSDWDIALMWAHGVDEWALLGQTESLRHALAQVLDVAESKIDLIDLRRANLAMRASVAQGGLPLWIGNPRGWTAFLQRTWREMEDFCYEKERGLYQAETARIAAVQAASLQQARDIANVRALTELEQAGMLHALQVCIENAIGKAKQWLKASGQVVPISAYDAFAALAQLGLLSAGELPAWKALIGLRNRIVHDYMNVSMPLVQEWVVQRREQFVLDFLLRPFVPSMP